MSTRWTLSGRGTEAEQLVVRAHQKTVVVKPVLTVTEVCRRLHKSRRQIYRYLRSGRLKPAAHVLGQWLFAESVIGQVTAQGVPGVVRRVFWDVDPSGLSLDRDRDFVIERVLEYGGQQALCWLFQAYPRSTVALFLRSQGGRRLSERAWRFWALQLRVSGRRARRRSWRHLSQR